MSHSPQYMITHDGQCRPTVAATLETEFVGRSHIEAPSDWASQCIGVETVRAKVSGRWQYFCSNYSRMDTGFEYQNWNGPYTAQECQQASKQLGQIQALSIAVNAAQVTS